MTTIEAKLEAPPREAPGPKGLPLLGSALPWQQEGNANFHARLWREHGDIAGFTIGPWTMISLARPEHVKRVLLTERARYAKGRVFAKARELLGEGLFVVADERKWSRNRRIMQPLFRPSAIGRFTQDVVEATRATTASWAEAIADGAPIDAQPSMMQLAIAAISRTMFSQDLAEISPEVGEAVTYCLEYIAKRTLAPLDLPVWVPTPTNARFTRARALLDEVVAELIAARRAGASHDDMLSRMIEATDTETGERLDDAQIRAEIMTIFLAGHETTAIGLSWALGLVAQRPELARRIAAEHDAVVGAAGRERLCGDDLPALELTRRTMMEAMRLYPPIWVIPREAVEDDVIDGVHVPKGAIVSLCLNLVHRHPEVWDEPDRFDPDRFLPAAVEARDRYAWVPFGAGPRTCLGNSFALMEMTLAAAEILGRFELELLDELPEAEAVVTLRPAGPVRLRVRPR